MNDILPWIQSLAPMTVLAYLVKRWVDGMDDEIRGLKKSVDDLKDGVGEMALKNAEDHGSVTSKIAAIEAKLEGMRSPWSKVV